MPAAELKALRPGHLNGIDLVITSLRLAAARALDRGHRWRLAVLDEAQAIKNPGRQTDPRRQSS